MAAFYMGKWVPKNLVCLHHMSFESHYFPVLQISLELLIGGVSYVLFLLKQLL